MVFKILKRICFAPLSVRVTITKALPWQHGLYFDAVSEKYALIGLGLLLFEIEVK